MATIPGLADSQKIRLSRLEPQLKIALQRKDFKSAQNIIFDMRSFLTPTGHYAKLMEYKNQVYELAIEIGEYDIAERELKVSREKINDNTRVYLEATALLAICYLRTKRYEMAKPYIREVLQNERAIKSEKARKVFHKAIIERFVEESVLFSLRDDYVNALDIDEIQSLTVEILRLNENTEELYKSLGRSVPTHTRQILVQIDDYSKNQLSPSERLMLPSHNEAIKDEVVGKTVFSSLKRVIYNSLCDQKSDVYKALFSSGGMGIVLDKKYITPAVVSALVGMGIGIKALAVSAVALIIRFGLDVYCEHNKPVGIMEIRE